MTERRRRERLRLDMGEQGVALTAIAYGPNLRHLTGYDFHPTERLCLLLVTQRGEVLVVPRLHREDVDDADIDRVVSYTDAEGPLAALHAAIEYLGLSPTGSEEPVVGAVDESMRAGFLVALERALPGCRFVGAGALLDPMRMVKGREELESLASVVDLTDRALASVWPGLTEGTTELDAAEIVRGAFHAQGADATAFCIVGFGPNSAAAHHQPTRRALRPGDAVLVDIGARRNGFHSDITRVGFFGEPPEEYLRVHEVVGRALATAQAAVMPGVPVSEVDRAARQVIAAAGYGATFRHGVGHGIGLSVHEPPYLTASNEAPLQVGMTVTLEPGVYLLGRFGVRLEQVVEVTAEGASVLTGSSLEIVGLPA